MTESNNVHLTEAERIEIGRRVSEMNSIIKLASRVFDQDETTKEQMLETRRATESYWLWGVGVLGLVIDYFLREATFDFNFGTYIWITVAIVLVGQNFKLSQLEKEAKRIKEKLYDLDRLWFSAIGSDTFWKTKPYFEDLSNFDFELMSDKAIKCASEQRENIVSSVCERF